MPTILALPILREKPVFHTQPVQMSLRKWIFVSFLVLSFSQSQAADDVQKETVNNSKTQKNIPNEKGTNQVLAKGPHGLSVTVADILAEANKMPAVNRPEFLKNPNLIQQVVNNLLVRRVLAHEAVVEKLDNDGVVKAAIAVSKDRVLSDARLNQWDVRNEPSNIEVESYARTLYNGNPAKYEVAAQTRASHILIEKKDEKALVQVQELLDKLKSGAKFEELAKEFSKDPGSAARGGDLGFFGEGRMVKPFEDALKVLTKPGELSGPVESPFGYHIIRLDERKPKTLTPFAEVKDSLLMEARAAILSGKRIQMAQSISAKLQFEKDAIQALSQDSSAGLSGK
jgi:peptidyl-prolyl cis-trans isomerase C